MFANNFFNRDPNHVLWGKYYIEQIVNNNVSPKRIYAKSVLFRCGIISSHSRQYRIVAQGLTLEGDEIIIETKHQGIDFKARDFVEIERKTYQIESVTKDEYKTALQSMLVFSNNANTYWLLKLKESSDVELQDFVTEKALGELKC